MRTRHIDEMLRRTHAVAEVHSGRHFVYTPNDKGEKDHGDAYINYRPLGKPENQTLLAEVSATLLGIALMQFHINPQAMVTVIGPETLGAKMVDLLATRNHGQVNPVILIKTPDGGFMPKEGSDLELAARTPRFAMDDLLNAGKTLEKIRRAIGLSIDGMLVIGDRSDFSPPQLGVEEVISLERFTVARYVLANGPCPLCEAQMPIMRHPGHGWEFERDHPDYIGGYIDQ